MFSSGWVGLEEWLSCRKYQHNRDPNGRLSVCLVKFPRVHLQLWLLCDIRSREERDSPDQRICFYHSPMGKVKVSHICSLRNQKYLYINVYILMAFPLKSSSHWGARQSFHLGQKVVEFLHCL